MPAPNAEDTTLLIDALRAAGDIARRWFGQKIKIWNKAGTPVTEADIEIDGMLRLRLGAARPDYGWLSEETADTPERLTRGRVFVVDPIDGTHGFIKNRPQFTISAAVVDAGDPVAAAIYNPITEEMFSAALGGGAALNGNSIRVSQRGALEGASALGAKKDFSAPPWPDSLKVENRASVAYRMALVAKGEFDAMMSLSRKGDWDLAAGDLIAREAGAHVTTRNGESLTFNGVIPEQNSVVCANPSLHALLLRKLAEEEK